MNGDREGRKSEQRQRTELIGVRCTPEEREALERAAHVSQQSVAALLRSAGLAASSPLLLSRDELVDQFTAAVDNVCDVAAIEVEVHELEVAPNGWRRDGRMSPLRRLVRAMEGAGLLDYTAIDTPFEEAS